jgi:hypothetical protein
MQIDLRNTELDQENGIVLFISGEEGDKYPELRIIMTEEDMPGLRQIWEQGCTAEFRKQMGTSEQMANHEELWAYLLTKEGELGDFARAGHEAYKTLCASRPT